MQKLYIVLSLILLVVVTVFALTNNTAVTVNLLGLAEWDSKVAILILVCFTAGVILMALFDLGRQVRTWKETKSLKKQVKSIEEERDLLRQRVAELSRTGGGETNTTTD